MEIKSTLWIKNPMSVVHLKRYRKSFVVKTTLLGYLKTAMGWDPVDDVVVRNNNGYNILYRYFLACPTLRH